MSASAPPGETEEVERRDRRLAVIGSIGIGIGVLPVVYKLVERKLGFASSIPPAFLYLGMAILITILVVATARLLLSRVTQTSEEGRDGNGTPDVRRGDLRPPV
jgi:hypothetical protein